MAQLPLLLGEGKVSWLVVVDDEDWGAGVDFGVSLLSNDVVELYCKISVFGPSFLIDDGNFDNFMVFAFLEL